MYERHLPIGAPDFADCAIVCWQRVVFVANHALCPSSPHRRYRRKTHPCRSAPVSLGLPPAGCPSPQGPRFLSGKPARRAISRLGQKTRC
eukprot:scaffold33599_cov112-Isochrysis_galbana.AAC.2